MGQLRVNKVRSAGRVSIDAEPISIGRSSRNTITLRSTEVSRCHCIVEAIDGVTRIRDLGSHHGTKVNGEPVTESVLHDGDRIRIGRFELTFVDPDEAPRAHAETEAAQCQAEAAQREAQAAQHDAEAAQHDAEVAQHDAEAARREVEVARREAELARREAEAARHEAEAGQRHAEAQRDDLQDRLTDALAGAEAVEADLARQVKLLRSSQHDTAQRSETAGRVIRQFAASRRQVLEAWQKLAVVHRTQTELEALWVETEEQTQDVESAAPEELQELLDRREAIAERLGSVQAARDAAMGSLQSALDELAGLEAASPSIQPAGESGRRRRGPFRFLRSTGS